MTGALERHTHWALSCHWRSLLNSGNQQNPNPPFPHLGLERAGGTGKRRELHIDKALRVIDWKNNGDPRCKINGTEIQNCEYFRLERFELSAERKFPMTGKSFHALFVAEG